MAEPRQPPRVVIAEDEPRILRSLAFIVEREGGLPVACNDGRAALEAILADPPRLAILDLMMPGLDGLAVCRAVRAEPRLRELPILVVTALGQKTHEQEALAAGATAYVRKPFDPRRLRDQIVAYLQPIDG